MGDSSNGDAWEMLGAFGHELEYHGHFCTDYGLQRNTGDGTCCPSLQGGLELETSISNDNSCCGTTARLTLTTAQGHGVGFIDCHEAAFLGPLVECGAIQVSARIGSLVGWRGPPIGGNPPIIVYVKGKVPWLEEQTSLNLQTAIVTLVKKLDLELNEEAIRRIRPPTTVRPRKCTCTGESCFLLLGASAPRGGHACGHAGHACGIPCGMTAAEGAPVVLARFSALARAQDWAGAVLLVDEMYAALPAPGVNPDMRAMALQHLSVALVEAPAGQGQDGNRAVSLLEEAEAIFAALVPVPTDAQEVTWNSLEAVLSIFGRLPEATTWTTKLLDLDQARGLPGMVGKRGCIIGEKLVREGGERNCALAVPLLKRALDASATLAGHSPPSPKAADFRMQALSYLGNALTDLGEFDEALTYTRLLVADMEDLGDAGGIAGALRTRAMIHDRRGAKADAISDLQTLLKVAVPGCSGLPEETRAALVVQVTEILARLQGGLM